MEEGGGYAVHRLSRYIWTPLRQEIGQAFIERMEEVGPQTAPEEIHLLTTELRSTLSHTIGRVARREVRVIVERYRGTQAVLISPADFERLRRIEQEGDSGTTMDVQEQARVVRIVTRFQALVTDSMHTHIDDSMRSAVRRILAEYGVSDVSNAPNT